MSRKAMVMGAAFVAPFAVLALPVNQDLILGTWVALIFLGVFLTFVYGVIHWLIEQWHSISQPPSKVRVTLEEMDYAATRNAAQAIERGRHGNP